MSSNFHLNEVKSMDNPDSPSEIYRNWSNLPLDVTLMILMKLGAVEILESVQFVCKMWYILCKEPSLWRTIRIHNLARARREINHEKMLFNAIDRSDGRLIDLDINRFGSDELCSYVSSRSSQLKRLRLTRCRNISADAVIQALEKLSCLEEVELSFCRFQVAKTVAIINACPSLTTFKFNKLGGFEGSYEACDEEALAIAGRMPELRHLQLIENNMTSVGLTAILDACPHLQSLELRECYELHLTPSLRKRLSEEIKDLQYSSSDSDEYSDIDYLGGHDDFEYSDDEIADYYRNKY
ncbi:F-box protein SKIP19-like [Silene latifolia]|uniref:F-box protein SKIP19-like n=1 Tax=Silene latifolia TaxID=37657 RepID=UPI003D787D10